MANPSKKEIPLQPLREEQVDQLARLINSGNCILVLGPYAALAPNTPQPIPLRAALAAALAAELGGDHVPDPHDLPMVCSAYMARPEAARLDLEFSVERFYRKHNNPGGLLEQVARLPFKLILTAGPDSLLQTAFQRAGKLWEEGYYCLNKTQKDTFKEESRLPYIYQLFGKVREHDSDGLVLTQKDHLDYLYSVVGEKTGIPAAIRNQIQQSKALLFLGFDFEYWYLRVLLHILQFAPSADKVFGLQQGPTPKLQATTHVFFKQQYKFTFLDTAANALLNALADRIGGPAQAMPRQSPALKLLFLHAEADEPYRQQLDRHLSALKEKYSISTASIHEIAPGETLDTARKKLLEEANILIPVITANYVATDWLTALGRQGLERHGAKGVRLVAVYGSRVFGGTDSFAGKAPILPEEDRSLSEFDNPDGAYAQIARALEKIIEGLL